MTEQHRHPVNPEKVRYFRYDGLVLASGRDNFAGVIYAHLRNADNLQSARQLIGELNQEPQYWLIGKEGLFEERTVCVTGAAINPVKTCANGKPIYDHGSVGIWVPIINERLIKKMQKN